MPELLHIYSCVQWDLLPRTVWVAVCAPLHFYLVVSPLCSTAASEPLPREVCPCSWGGKASHNTEPPPPSQLHWTRRTLYLAGSRWLCLVSWTRWAPWPDPVENLFLSLPAAFSPPAGCGGGCCCTAHLEGGTKWGGNQAYVTPLKGVWDPYFDSHSSKV